MSADTIVPDETTLRKNIQKIGLWGASGSGKTSFLAALYVAVNETKDDWKIIGDNRASVDFLTRMTDSMTRRHIFPPKTEAIQKLSWTIVGEIEQTVGGRFRRREEKIPLRFRLDLIDAAGRLFAGEDGDRVNSDDDLSLDFNETRTERVEKSDADQLVEELASCDGLVYLFDPLREHEHGDEFRHFQWTLQHIAFLCDQNSRFGTHLPHYLAVCITKLDDPKVFATADNLGYLTADTDDQYLFPRVHPDRTEDLYVELGGRSPTGSALKVHDSIRRYFHRDRVRYFATSSVGFYVPPGANLFRRANFRNVVPDNDNGRVIRGDIHPINVLEPLLWIGRMVSQ